MTIVVGGDTHRADDVHETGLACIAPWPIEDRVDLRTRQPLLGVRCAESWTWLFLSSRARTCSPLATLLTERIGRHW